MRNFPPPAKRPRIIRACTRGRQRAPWPRGWRAVVARRPRAGGQAPGGAKPAAQFNLIEIDGAAPEWRIKLTRRGLLDGSAKPEVLRVDWLSRARGAYAGSSVAS